MSLSEKSLDRFSRKSIPVVVYVILGAIIISYVFPSGMDLWKLGNRRNEVSYGEVWRFFTSMFVHANLIHLLLNSISLLIFGLKVERNLGHWRLVVIFTLSGIFGSLTSFIFGQSIVSVGASGGIFGLVSATLLYYYRFRDDLGESGQNELGYAAGTMIANIIHGLMQPNTDNWAHIGGLLAGLVLTWLMLTNKDIRPSESFSQEEHPGIDSNRLLAMKIASILLFIGFIVGFKGLLFNLTFLRNVSGINVLF